MEACKLIVIHRQNFLEMVKQDSELSMHLLKLLCARVRYTSEMAEDAAILNVPARLAKRLLKLANEHGRKSDSQIILTLSQSELADFLGVSRQIVNQYLKIWRERGWVKHARGKITICDATALLRAGEKEPAP